MTFKRLSWNIYTQTKVGFNSFSHRFWMPSKMLWTLPRILLISGNTTLTDHTKAFRTRAEHVLNTLCTFNIRHVYGGNSISEALQNEVKKVWTQFCSLILGWGTRVEGKCCRVYLLFVKVYQLLPILWKSHSLLSLHRKLTVNIGCLKMIRLVVERIHCHNIFLTSRHLKDRHFLLINNLLHNKLSFQCPSMSFAFW